VLEYILRLLENFVSGLSSLKTIGDSGGHELVSMVVAATEGEQRAGSHSKEMQIFI
jgi:hypothetical protein